ncbi:MAG TPA: tetratricopeptide repeat protein [Candidatus Limnocylindrales bacterium]|nr:tetratricopeptide repeat protein [Candidatus Limnocylindrales bacterium]
MSQAESEGGPVATMGAGLTFDDPEAYIPRDRRRALATGAEMPDRVHGAGLFADISGFTPLTEALAAELGPHRGAEELTAVLGRVFHEVIGQLDRFGGDVIYFSGDAITGWIDEDDGRRATAAALAMQEAIGRVGTVVTPGGSTFTLAMKVAIAVGKARRFVVGDPEIQLIDVLAGRLVDDLAASEHHASKGEVVLDPSAVAALGSRVELSELRVDPANGRGFGVVRALTVDVPDAPSLEPETRLPDDLVRPWLLPAVNDRLRAGRGEFLAELRPAFPLFLRFGGIDYDDDDDAIVKLDDLVRRAQRIATRYGGNVLQLTLGDKGAYLYGVFGAPLAHEDDAARAAAAALELRDLEGVTAATGIQIGITHGRLRSGTYGHVMRRTFVCLGDAVNLSARLMSAAPAGGIYVSEAVQHGAGDAFIWESIPDLTVKGKTAPVVVFALTGSLARMSRRQTRYQLPLVGRRSELDRLQAGLAEARAGRGRVVAISAEAGMGKSRLVAEFVRTMRRRGQTLAFGECQSFGANSSYFAWREIWRRLLGIEDGDVEDEQRQALEGALSDIDPALVARTPLLEAVLGITIPDTDVTRSFDAKLRKASLEDLLATCLRARATRPLVIVIEDCHWIDQLSRDLLETLVRTAATLPVLFVLAYRPAASVGGGLGLERLPQFAEIVLGELDAAETRLLIRSKLEQLAGASGGRAAEAPDALVDLITTQSQGNPFYVEELLIYLSSKAIDPNDAGALRALEIPESLESLVLSRIDTVGEAPRRTLKVASVIGRVFHAPTLPGVYPELGTPEAVLDQLDSLRAVELVTLDQEAEQAYLFKHVLTQEVAYESLPFAIRAQLHGRVGAYIEATAADSIDRELDILAHHYWRSDNEAKKVEFLGRAGESAQATYANAAAIDYYERLVPLLPDAQRGAVLLKLGKVLELVGDWSRGEAVASEALALAIALEDGDAQGWAKASLGEIARKQGQFDEATARLDAAADLFTRVGDDAGLGKVWHLAGTVAAQRGDLVLARRRYQESLAIRERLGDGAGMGSLYSNLAIVAEYGGDLPETRRMGMRALEIRTEIGDRWGIGVSQSNLGAIAVAEGNLEEARSRIEEALRLLREVGDTWMVANAQNNLGNATRDLGDLEAARASYAESLRSFGTYDDRWALAILLEDVGLLAARSGDHLRAVELIEAAAVLRVAIGAPRTPTLEGDLRDRLAPSLEALGILAVEEARARGRSLDLAAAIQLGLAICVVPSS